MSIRISTVLAVTITALAAPLALASNGYTRVEAKAPGASVGKTREQVRQELEASRRDGSYERINANSPYRWLEDDTGETSKTREQVRQELEASKEDGSYGRINSNSGHRSLEQADR
ncbi:DUF4148 domain-containing protein [Caldimonas brevitalea]|uniref:DUF4148 domain-containing protein n=1 Tax=Caldimonas brevitalea TaxID=413882 RepID=A0A0G3BML9_9BURK|nr:DUF4148 domain-containing protein [Caldimonas brevitalea]AKJ30699.1 hypothetical protein AAW51_4008 [Caldimonas brevitalea]